MNQHFPVKKKTTKTTQNKTLPNPPSVAFTAQCSAQGEGGSWSQTHGHVLGLEPGEMGPLESLTATRWNFPNRRRDKSSADLCAGKISIGGTFKGRGAHGAAHPPGTRRR